MRKFRGSRDDLRALLAESEQMAAELRRMAEQLADVAVGLGEDPEVAHGQP